MVYPEDARDTTDHRLPRSPISDLQRFRQERDRDKLVGDRSIIVHMIWAHPNSVSATPWCDSLPLSLPTQNCTQSLSASRVSHENVYLPSLTTLQLTMFTPHSQKLLQHFIFSLQSFYCDSAPMCLLHQLHLCTGRLHVTSRPLNNALFPMITEH